MDLGTRETVRRKRRVATSNFIIITLLRYYFYVTGNDLNNSGFRNRRGTLDVRDAFACH